MQKKHINIGKLFSTKALLRSPGVLFVFQQEWMTRSKAKVNKRNLTVFI